MLRVTRCSWMAVALTLITTSALVAEDWPRFRGVNGRGVSDSTGLPTEYGPDTNVIWKVDVQEGSSSPVIAAGNLYLASFRDDQRTVTCLDAESGEQLWERTLTRQREENSNYLNGPATCTPASDGRRVVVFFPDTGLLCYSADGQLQWQVEVGPYHCMHGIANSPIIAGDKVLLMADQLRGSYLAAYELQTGKQVWKVDRANGLTGGYSTPSLYPAGGETPVILTMGPGGLNAYNLETGEEVFSVPGVANAPVTIPVVEASRIFLCEPVGEAMPIGAMLERFDTDKDGSLSLEEVKASVPMFRLLERMDKEWGNGDGVVDPSEWDAAFQSFIGNGGLTAVDVATTGETLTGTVTWNFQKQVPYVSSPVSYEGLLYMVDNGGIVTTVSAADGEQVTKSRLKKGGSTFYASPVAADGKIFLIDTAGQLTVLKAGQEWSELATADMGEPCFATPAICDGRLYLRTKTKLYCFGRDG